MESTNNLISTQSYLYYPYHKNNDLLSKNNIPLTTKETQIFTTIKSILSKHNKKTVCRVAGGWVRDKLLGRKNDDIDIALDDMSGEELAKLINDELYPGEEKYGIVSQNCEKSKHLATATMKIYDMFIDFVNLRSEKYTEHSRVPVVDIGTPEEDARRRDITINSMFYNINTEKVEDFLDMGVTDLINGAIRTPLDPIVTFMDDPLRILRTIRFAIRFQFELDNEILKIKNNEEIKSALYKKISNERIAKELCLMLEGNKPECAINLLYEFGIIDACLKLQNMGCKELENNENLIKNDLCDMINLVIVGSYILENFVESENKIKFDGKINLEGAFEKNELGMVQEKENEQIFFNKYLYKINHSNKDENNINDSQEHLLKNNYKELKKLFYLNLITLPFRNYLVKSGKENSRVSVTIIKESLKLQTEYIKEILNLHENLDNFLNFMNSGETLRLSSARVIRKVKSHYIHKLCLTAICQEYLNFYQSDKVYETIDISYIHALINKYQKWYEFLEQENLMNVDTLEPIFKGNEMVTLIDIKGKEIGLMIEVLIENQIIKPDLTKEEAIIILKEKKEEIKLLSGTNTPLSSGKKGK